VDDIRMEYPKDYRNNQRYHWLITFISIID
jgi:hypothetical protein